MNKLRSSVRAAAFLLLCAQVPLLGDTSADVDDALVMVIVRSFVGRGAGNGFVIGDGTLVVTAHHLVFGQSKQGGHSEAGLVSVVSPYVGDGCEATIVAADEELDLAVLKIPWAGHPAVQLAQEDDLLSAERLTVTGIPKIIQSLGESKAGSMEQIFKSQSENLPVDYIAVRRRVPLFISLSETGELEQGWSGSPMLLPDSAVVAGCFTSLDTTRGGKSVRARGPAVAQVRHLLRKSDAEQSLKRGDSVLPRRDDGIEAFLTLAQAYRHYIEDQYGWAADKIKQFIDMRPESSFAYILSASNAAGQNDFDLADRHYRKAISLNPEAPSLRFYCAQFLAERRPDQALKLLEGLWEQGELKPSAAAIMFNILSSRGEFRRAAELLTEALELNPRNGNLWMGLGACRFQTGDPDGAIAGFAKAVELLPERGPFRGQLARILEKSGRLDEAEEHFRELLNVEPDNPVVHFWLAEFLLKHRPDAGEEALKEAQAALDLPARRGMPEERIRQLVEKLRSGSTPADAP